MTSSIARCSAIKWRLALLADCSRRRCEPRGPDRIHAASLCRFDRFRRFVDDRLLLKSGGRAGRNNERWADRARSGAKVQALAIDRESGNCRRSRSAGGEVTTGQRCRARRKSPIPGMLTCSSPYSHYAAFGRIQRRRWPDFEQPVPHLLPENLHHVGLLDRILHHRFSRQLFHHAIPLVLGHPHDSKALSCARRKRPLMSDPPFRGSVRTVEFERRLARNQRHRTDRLQGRCAVYY